MTIGDRIKERRNEMGMSQQDLADESQLNRNSIHRYENNRTMPRMPQLKRIANALKTSVDYLMSGEESLPPELSELLAALPMKVEEVGGYLKFSPQSKTEMFEEMLLERFDTLNEIGKIKAIQYVTDISRLPEYSGEVPNDAKT